MSHLIRAIDSYSHQGYLQKGEPNHYNEDRSFIGTSLFSVIDGATALIAEDMGGLNPSAFTSKFLAEFFANNQTSSETAEELIKRANKEFLEILTENWPHILKLGKLGPCAAVACIKIQENNKATIANLSDCAILAKKNNVWEILSIQSKRHQELDQQLASAMFKELDQGKNIKTVKDLPQIAALREKNRKLLNLEYGVFNAEPEALNFLHSQQIDTTDISHIALFTDGYIHPNTQTEEEGLIKSAQLIEKLGCFGAYQALKELYDADAEFKKFKRLKHMDDSTALLLEL